MGRPKRFFGSVFGKNSIAYMDDKYFLVERISCNLQSVRAQNNQIGYMRVPTRAPSSKPWFWQFFEYSGKTRDIFRKYCLILCSIY